MRYRTITSPANPIVKEAAALRERGRKRAYEAFLIEGPRIVEMAARSGAAIKRVFFIEDYSSSEEGMRLLRNIAETGAEMFQVSRGILSKLADTETPQGLVAIASCRPHSLETLPLKKVPLLIVVDGVQDPGNLGTIIRTADAAGSEGVIMLPGTCDAFMPKVLRATSGSVFSIPLVYSGEEELVKWLRSKSLRVIVTALDASRSLYDEDLSRPLALIFGNEARGVNSRLRRQAHSVIKIPLSGEVESLNVSVAAAVCMFEAVRQRRGKGPAQQTAR